MNEQNKTTALTEEQIRIRDFGERWNSKAKESIKEKELIKIEDVLKELEK